ncbi:MAG: DUF4296 domain-containing protein [Bacteroidales bacterium]|nr:DUF4296 domain-containing protein [Bacteroidales bacterium]
MKKILKLIFIVILFSGCGQNRIRNIPEDIIPRDSMISLMVDIHLADGILSVKKFNSHKHKYQIESYYAYILQKHSYTREQYDSSVVFYSNYPEEYDIMYEEVLTELSKMEGEIVKLRAIQDSIIKKKNKRIQSKKVEN